MKLNTALYDNFEEILQEGLIKVCKSADILKGDMLLASDDITLRWDELIKDYIGDAVNEFNDYPEAAIAWPAFLGMAVAHYWDCDWESHKDDPYTSFYGERGWDDMDEHILRDILGMPLASDEASHLSNSINSCALATLALMRKQNLEPQTADGFYILSRAYTVMFRIGAAVELQRLKYHFEAIDPNALKN